MKHFFLCIAVTAMCSCATVNTYHFVQVMKTEPVDKTNITSVGGGMVYEDVNCSVVYKFWSEGGALTFSIYNKTDQILLLDLTKSFFIKNGYASDYSLTNNDRPVMAIPPKVSRIISGSTISKLIILDCDLTRFPTDSASITYSEDNSPLVFSNYLTYNVGNDSKEWKIENKFYVSKVSNYTYPVCCTYELRSNKPCQNLTEEIGDDYKPKYSVDVYDAVYNFDTSNCFYINYEKETQHKLYNKSGYTLKYSDYYEGYIRTAYYEGHY